MINVFNYQLYFFYERESKTSDENIATICKRAMNLLDKIGLDEKSDSNAIQFLKRFIDIKIESMQYTYGNNLDTNFNNMVCASKNYSKVIKNDDNSYNCYPFSVTEPSYYDIIINYCIENEVCIDDSKIQLGQIIENNNKVVTDNLLEGKLNFYYGDVRYILIRTKAIFNAICDLNNREDLTNDEKLIVGSILKIVKSNFYDMCILSNLNDSSNIENTTSLDEIITSKDAYDKISSLYVNVLNCENKLEFISQKIWKSFFENNDGMLIHKLTGGIVESDKMDKICTSFSSKSARFVPSYSSNVGYCYDFDINNVLALCEDDVGSWRVSREEFIQRGLPSSWQYDGSNIFYEYGYHSKLFSPEYIERQVLNSGRFAEIVLNNNDKKNKPIFAYYTEDATDDEIEKITEVANKQSIEVKLLHYSKENKTIR